MRWAWPASADGAVGATRWWWRVPRQLCTRGFHAAQKQCGCREQARSFHVFDVCAHGWVWIAVWLWGIAGCVDCAIAIQLGCRKRYGNFGKSMSRPWSRPTARSATRCSLIKGGSPRVGCGTRGPGFFHLLGRIYSRARGVRSCHTCASSHRLWRLACARLLFRVIIIGDPRRCLSPPCRMCMPCAPTCIVTVSLSASPRPGYK